MGAPSDLAAVLGDAATSCLENNCANTDQFLAGAPEDCARICTEVENCSHWTIDSSSKCFLRSGHITQVAIGSTSGLSGCSPAATKVSAVEGVRAVIASPALKACEGGAAGTPACPNLHAAMRTWQWGIGRAREFVRDATLEGYINKIAGDCT